MELFFLYGPYSSLFPVDALQRLFLPLAIGISLRRVAAVNLENISKLENRETT